MRFELWHVVSAVFFVFAPSGLATAADYVLDAAHAAVSFQVSHAGISWTHGRFNDVKGDFSVNSEDPANSQFAMTIATESIDTANQQRDDHLRGPDFFNAKQFPTIEFKSTEVTQADEGLTVTGELTLHGETKPLTMLLKGGKTAEMPPGVNRIGFSTNTKIKRSDFGMTNAIPMVGDDVYISISFEGTQK